MIEDATKRPSPSSALYEAFASLVLLMWMFVGGILGAIACMAVAVGDALSIADSGHEPTRLPIGAHVYWGILLASVAFGTLGYWRLRPRPKESARLESHAVRSWP